MSYFSPVIVIDDITEDEFKELKKQFGCFRVTLKAKYSYNSEIISVEDEDFKNIDKLNEDENYSYNQLMSNNSRF
jgi:hypothetical protein